MFLLMLFPADKKKHNFSLATAQGLINMPNVAPGHSVRIPKSVGTVFGLSPSNISHPGYSALMDGVMDGVMGGELPLVSFLVQLICNFPGQKICKTIDVVDVCRFRSVLANFWRPGGPGPV